VSGHGTLAGRALTSWFLIMLAETVHGILRRLLLAPAIGELRSNQIGVAIGALIIFAITWLLIRWIGASRIRPLLAVGLAWVALTAAFDAALGRALGYGWHRILADYDLARGGLMGFGLLAMALTPLACARLRR
jgi:hypothetical protein